MKALWLVVPHEGTWIEISMRFRDISPVASFPTRERGLKSPFNFFRHCGQTVVPHEGTWIEISSSAQPGSSGIVVPHEGTWIEIVYGW